MRIEFDCLTNADVPFVNTAVFRTSRGDVTIDRVGTYYTYDPEEKQLDMQWCGCYVWDGTNEDFDKAKQISDEIISLVRLEVDDDADYVLSEEDDNEAEPYYCRPLVCMVDGRVVPVLIEEAV